MALDPPDPARDRELVTAAQRGDRRALEDLLRLHQARLHAVCRRVLGTDADAADATQEAMLGVVRGLATFDGNARFSTWAYRIAVNASLDELRRRSRRPTPGLPDEGDDGSGPADLLGAAPDAATGVAQRLDVDAALRTLTPEFRAAVVLRDLCQLDYAEISEVLGIPPGTVRSRISRGRAALVPVLAGNPGDGDDRRTSHPPMDPSP